jgi:hypothetical protein
MELADILSLAKAGFTKEQIVALSGISKTPAAPAAPAPATPATPAAPATPATPATDPIMAEIQKLTGALQASALLNSNMPPQTQSAEDILAEIINPPTAGKK